MKYKIDWIRFALFAIIAGGLILITESILMSIGIFLLLFVADYLIQDIADWFERRKKRRERENENRNENK